MGAGLFLLGLTTSLAFWPGLLDAATAPRWALLALAIPVALLFVQTSLRLRWLVALLLPALTLLWTTSPLNGSDEAIHLLILVGAFWLGSSLLDFSPMWAGIASGVAVSGVIGVAQWFGWSMIPQAVPPAGLFMNANMFAESLMVGLIVAASMQLWILAALAAVGILFAGSKAVFAALALTFAVSTMKRRPWTATVIFSLLLWSFLLMVWMAHPSVAIRFGYWATALGDSIPFGHGLGSYAAAFPGIEFAHSELVQLIYEVGILTLPIAAALLYALGGEDCVERRVLIGIATVGLFSFPLHMPLTAMAAAIAAGHLVGARDRLRGLEHDRPVAIGVGA